MTIFCGVVFNNLFGFDKVGNLVDLEHPLESNTYACRGNRELSFPCTGKVTVSYSNHDLLLVFEGWLNDLFQLLIIKGSLPPETPHGCQSSRLVLELFFDDGVFVRCKSV
jgi:hypothetical protein